MRTQPAESGPLLFALDATHEFGASVAAHLGVRLSALEERAFEDGEHKSRPLVNVRGRDVYVIQSLFGSASESVNDKLCRLLFFIGALHDAAAASVTAVVPYLCYARKDRKSKPRDPVTTRYVAALFEATGTARILTMDVHNLAAFQNAFRCGADHLEALPLLVAHFETVFRGQRLTVVSPDIGGVKRVERFREVFAGRTGIDVTTAFMEKQRSAGVVTGDRLFGDVRDRAVLILDDLISTGTTVGRTAAASLAAGARSVHAAATHGLFLGKAPQRLEEARLEGLVVTNTVLPFRMAGPWAADHLTVLDASAMFGAAIHRVHTGGSLVELLGG